MNRFSIDRPSISTYDLLGLVVWASNFTSSNRRWLRIKKSTCDIIASNFPFSWWNLLINSGGVSISGTNEFSRSSTSTWYNGKYNSRITDLINGLHKLIDWFIHPFAYYSSKSTCGTMRMHPPPSVNVWHRENAPTLHSQRVAARECTHPPQSTWGGRRMHPPPSSVNMWHRENAPTLLSQHVASWECTHPPTVNMVAEECTPHPPQSTCGIVRMHPPSSVNMRWQKNAPPTLLSQHVASWECTHPPQSTWGGRRMHPPPSSVNCVAARECTHPPQSTWGGRRMHPPPSSVNVWQQENAPTLLGRHEVAEECTPYIWQLLPNSIRKTTSLYSSATRQLSIPENIETSFGDRMFFLAVNQ